MFFLASKLLWIVSAPLTVLLGLVVLGALLLMAGRWRPGRAVVVVGAGGLVGLAVMPVGAMLLRPIEDCFPPLPETVAAPTGIIVLGGSTDQDIALSRGRVTIATAGDRMTEAVILARRFPEARIVFTGGSADIGGSVGTEAADARRLWTTMGLPDERITTEDRSRNTDENVRFTKALVSPQPGQRWVLVTSAFHMARSVALFRANGWPVIPDPVDYRTRGTPHDFQPSLDVEGNWQRFTMAFHEWIGLIAYRVSGRTQTILPDP